MNNDLIPSIYDYPQYYPITSPGCDGDVQFYIEEAMASGGPVLEIGCGTGRTLLPIAASGIEIVGIDNSECMLQACRNSLGQEVKNITLHQMDMCSLDFDNIFQTVIIPYRAFLCLFTVQEQRECLAGIYRSLVPGGKLILNLFDPDFATLADFSKIDSSFRMFRQGVVPETGKKLMTWAATTCDSEQQILDEIWKYEEFNEKGYIESSWYGRFKIRFIFRFEMQHLLERQNFKIEALYGGFDRSSYQPGREQIWVCSKK